MACTCVCTGIALSQAASPTPSATAATSGALPAPTTVRITFATEPPPNALVTWGKTSLGRITTRAELVVIRPRDSGPLDVVVRAAGFLPVQTRAHTFADTRVSVKLTRPTETATLLGYRVPIDAGAPIAVDPAAAPHDPNATPPWNVSPAWNMVQPSGTAPVTPIAATPAPGPAAAGTPIVHP